MVSRWGLALAAGGGFAALSWDSRPAGQPGDATGLLNRDTTAEWPGVVKEDIAWPQLNAPDATRESENLSGITRVRPGVEPRTALYGWAGAAAETTAAGRFARRQSDELETVTTAVPHSRAPP
jgi:hypothetical protein